MSARAGITKAIKDKLSTVMNGTGNYVTNLYTNVGNASKHFDNIPDYPYVSVTPGPEQRDAQPSRQTIAELTVYIRVYVKNAEDPQHELEDIIADLETFIDINQRIVYNVTTPEGEKSHHTMDGNIISITTDEGLLSPFGAAEIAVNIRYEKTRLM